MRSARFLFFSSDRGEPMHVHVARDRKAAKFWLEPVRMEYNHGLAPAELNRVTALVQVRDAGGRHVGVRLTNSWNPRVLDHGGERLTHRRRARPGVSTMSPRTRGIRESPW